MNRIKFGPIDLFGCREALERMDDHLDGELPADESRKVSTHLKICHLCAKKFRFENLFLSDVRAKMNSVQMPPEVRSQVQATLDEEKNK